MPIKYIDLFSGIGSFHYSFTKLGFECVMACDINENARNTYFANYKKMPLGDIIDIDPKTIPTYDILCGGFPCQPFSNIGKHKGFNDARGTLFNQIMKFVVFHKPKVIILENVSALLTHDEGKTFLKIKTAITNNNYKLTYKILKCDDYGIPQMRKRLFIIAVKNDVVCDIDSLLNFENCKKKMTLKKYMNKNFVKTTAFTIRCGGKRSPINDKHNWDGYMIDGQEYRLTLNDCLKLQGFPENFKLCGSNGEKWKQLGNTIPTIFTELIGSSVKKIFH
jgi:DNA (cytosine-5)-methyltransferase 1